VTNSSVFNRLRDVQANLAIAEKSLLEIQERKPEIPGEMSHPAVCIALSNVDRWRELLLEAEIAVEETFS
jgi:hypothetical protein